MTLRRIENVEVVGHGVGLKGAQASGAEWRKQVLVLVMTVALVFAGWPENTLAYQDTQNPPPQPVYAPQDSASQNPTSQDAGSAQPPYAQQTPEQLQRLVAPIALYPDSLVAQILAGATFPEQVVEADRWVQAHPDLKGEALGQAVDQEA